MDVPRCRVPGRVPAQVRPDRSPARPRAPLHPVRSRSAALLPLGVWCAACGGSTGPAGDGGDPPTASAGLIVFASDRDGDFDLYTMEPDGSGVVRLTDEPGDEREPRWSPSRARIVFSSDRDGPRGVYTVAGTGGPVTRLADGISPDWSPNGQQIVYVDVGLRVMDRDGGNDREILADTRPLLAGVDWESAGPRIAFTVADGFVGFTNHIDVVEPDGSGRERLIPFSSFPSWSPDGTRMSALAMIQGRLDIWTVGAPTETILQGSVESRAAWSPNGAQLAYSSQVLTGSVPNHEIFVIPAASGEAVRLTVNEADDRDPDWR